MTASLEWSVAEWLTSFGMKELTPKFLEHGYETEKLCSKLQAEDMEAMCINNPMQLEVIYTQSEMLRKKREEKIAVGNGQAPAFVPRPSESTDGTSTNLQLVKHKVRKIPAVQQQRKTPDKIHVPPPESQRTFAGYTKLQLKLKIKEEIRKDHIVLSEPPYCLEDGSANEELLQELAENYAERFNLESLTVYYALKDVWRFTANEKSEIATPMSGELKKVRKPAETPPELDTYSEPFDNKLQSPVKPMGKQAKKVATVSGSVSPKNPPASFQPVSELPGTYADPFDALPQTLPQITKDSPPSAELKRRKPIPSSPKPTNSSPGKSRDDSNIKWKVTPNPMNKTHSFTLPPPGSPSISSSSSEESPKKSPRTRRFWSPFRRRKNASSSTSQSPQHQQDLSKPQAAVHGSMEDIPKQKSPARFRQSTAQNRHSRQSLPGALSGLPHITTDSGLISDSASEDSPIPAKKLSGSCGMLIDSGHDTPPVVGAGNSPSGSPGEERVVSRVKALAIKRSNSDFELSNVVELYVEGQDKPFRFKKAQSTDELDKDESSSVDGSGKKKRTSNIISRLFKPKSRKDKLKVAGNKSKSHSVSDDLITPSRSMPNVSRAVAAVIHSEYTEVFDDDVRGKAAKTPSPSPSPRVPQRNRPHTTKPHRTTYTQSPKTSPPTHHRLMVKSDSIGSSEMTIHSIPSSKDDSDATIELNVPGAAVPSVCDSHAAPEEEDFGDVFQSSDAEKSPERDSSQARADGSGSTSAKDVQRPIAMVRTCSGNKPPLAPKPVISRERLTSGGSQKRASRTSVGSSTSTSPSHSLSPAEGHVDGSKPPPKPTRRRSRNMRSLSPASSETRSGEEGYQPSEDQLLHLPAVTVEVVSSPPAGEVLTSVHRPRQRWPSGSNPPPKPPKPLSLKGSASLPLHLKAEISPSLLHSVEKKLAEEGVDLSQAPYTNQHGEYNIPSGLVSRYVIEMDYSPNEIALSLEDIRRRSLHKHNQKYVPFVGRWKDHSLIDRSSVKAFLTSIGLPMYCSVFEEFGYSSVELIQSASPEQLYILPFSDRHRQLLSKALLSL